MIRLLADECFDRRIVEGLRLSGHDVTTIQELGPGDMAYRTTRC